jgi:hypothetical protein
MVKVYFLINLPNLSILRKLHNKFNILQKYEALLEENVRRAG